MKKTPLSAPDALDVVAAGIILAALGIGLSFGIGAGLTVLGLGTVLVGLLMAARIG